MVHLSSCGEDCGDALVVAGGGGWAQEQGYLKRKNTRLSLLGSASLLRTMGCGGPCCPCLPTPPLTRAPRGAPGDSCLPPRGNRIWEEGRQGDMEHCLNEGQSSWKSFRD